MTFQEDIESLRLPFLCVVMIFTFSCTQTEKYQGRYVSSPGDSRKDAAITVELKETGHGLWMMADEEVEIRWEVRKGQLLLHTKSGGVIIGKINGDLIEIQQPDSKVLYLRKAH